ncbi:MAG: hypothetical protein MZV65_20410 [Chromatiales bacterium]|nr:hypothetical protein [Chromatiales bacterium]
MVPVTFTLNLAACGGAPVQTVATAAGSNMSLSATFGTGTNYCVGAAYDAATGSLTKPPLP